MGGAQNDACLFCRRLGRLSNWKAQSASEHKRVGGARKTEGLRNNETPKFPPHPSPHYWQADVPTLCQRRLEFSVAGTKRTLNSGTPGTLCDWEHNTENRIPMRKSMYVVHGDRLSALFLFQPIMLRQVYMPQAERWNNFLWENLKSQENDQQILK